MLTAFIIIILILILIASAPAMASYGRQVIATTGGPLQTIADGRTGGAKPGGITIDWSTVTAVSGADLTLEDGTVVKIGDKYLRYGQVLDLIGTQEVQTVDLSPGVDPTGGTFTLTYGGQTTAPIAYNATGQAVENALVALSTLEPGDVVVTGPTAFVYTVTFDPRLGDVAALTANGAGMTTATAITIATTTAGAGAGKYGPADTTATDGRQILARGETYWLDQTVVMSQLGSDHAPVFESGTVWADRIIWLENGFTNAPTKAQVLAAFPEMKLVA